MVRGRGAAGDPLRHFGLPTRTWFANSFDSPTPAQVAAWEAIASGQHSLLVAPTGSGKTLAAFLHSLDRLSDPAQRRPDKVGVLYISPLKALAVDVERNLTAPLRGIQNAAEVLGESHPEVRVGVRTGDTPASERRRLATHPPDILITTPESLFLVLSSQAASTLDSLHTVIVDEIHALAGTKRGAHLMLSLERLDALHGDGGAQRIGLSATVRPAERVAAFLGGDRTVQVVNPPSIKQWQLDVEVPIEDMTDLSMPDADRDQAPNRSIWPFVEQRVLDLVDAHRSTLCFVNSRRVAERLTAHLNELHATRLGAEPNPVTQPAQVMAQSGASTGRDGSEVPLIARAHHGSVSKERRAEIEADLKAGRLPCVVATSSLELGIDMGQVDQVIQIASPPSIASGLQRVGRAGHQVGAVSKGVFLPTHRGDLIESAVVVERMEAGAIEEVRRLRNPLDVLAQHLVSWCIDHPVTAEEAFSRVVRSDPFRDLPHALFVATLDMLTGRYPSEDWAELRPRLVWDRATDLLTARPGARQLVTISGGTIPDRGLFGVFLAGDGAGRRVGELDEEMVYESRVGDVFTLGTSSWRIEEITPHQVLVTPAPGAPGRLPFWRGDSASRPLELGLALGQFTERLSQLDPAAAQAELAGRGLDAFARANLVSHLTSQRQAAGVVPGASTVLVERTRDELGDWRVLVHAPWGSAVLAPWALAIEARARDRHGVEARAIATNDGIIIRLPDVDAQPPGADLLDVAADDLDDIITNEVFGSALFAARFRECAGRALLLPRRDPRRRSPLWQQRMRAAQLLQVASQYPDFPIVLETLRECLEDVFDLPGLRHQVREIESRRVRVVEVETAHPSPFAQSLLFNYVGEFVYDADQPLAERVLAAAAVDQGLLAELLGHSGDSGALLDPEAASEVEDELQRRAEAWRASSIEALWDVVRTLGPLTTEEVAERAALDDVDAAVALLLEQRRLARVVIAGVPHLAVADDLGLLRDALGVPIPPGHGAEAPQAGSVALARLVTRWARSHAGFSTDTLAARWGLAASQVERAAAGLSGADALTRVGDQWWHPRVVQAVRRRALARLRREVEPVEPTTLARFAVDWQEVADPGRGLDALVAAIDLLAGHPIPASMLETVVLPARVTDYTSAMLDELLSRGEVVWNGRGAIGRQDGWVQLWPADLVLPDAGGPVGEAATALLERLSGGGAWTLRELTEGLESGEQVDALWELVWAGHLTSDSLAALRELSAGGALKRPRTPRPGRRLATRPLRTPRPTGVPGRWSRVLPTAMPETEALVVRATTLLSRHGVVSRGTVQSDVLFGNFSEAYRVLAALEESGGVRRGYFVDGLGAAQFALPGAVDRLRSAAPSPHQPEEAQPALLLAACDPANPFGAALPWPDSPGHRPTRRAGALVLVSGGRLLAHLERGAHTLLCFTEDEAEIGSALERLALAVRERRFDSIRIDTVNGAEAISDRAWAQRFERVGFRMTPQGFRMRG